MTAMLACLLMHISRSRSLFQKGKGVCQNNILRPTKMPDVDNILKAVLDGLNKFAYADDKQVVTATMQGSTMLHKEMDSLKSPCARKKSDGELIDGGWFNVPQ